MIKVLFVCLGNICRSPLAEAIFQEKVRKSGLNDSIKCDSAGTARYHVGETPDPRTVETAQNHDIPIDHRGQQFKKNHQNEFDYLIAMDSSNYENMVREMGNKPDSLHMMRDFDSEGRGKDVPDPYYGGMNGFENIYQILDRSAEELLNKIRKDHQL